MGHVGQREIWLPGCEKDPKASDVFPHKSVHAISVAPVKRALDLFCGRKSAGRVLEKMDTKWYPWTWTPVGAQQFVVIFWSGIFGKPTPQNTLT